MKRFVQKIFNPKESKREPGRTHTHTITVASELQCVHTRRTYIYPRGGGDGGRALISSTALCNETTSTSGRNQDFKNTTISRFPIAARRFSICGKLAHETVFTAGDSRVCGSVCALASLSSCNILQSRVVVIAARHLVYYINSERNKKITNQAESLIKANARTKRRPIAEEDEEE
uniref:Uncharacterized protein n=1 Tax=Trichogramma kaykai TaxID=54128 RepID=A0ABD2XPV8_9HYME